MEQQRLLEIASELAPGQVHSVELEREKYWVKVCGEDKNTRLRRWVNRASRLSMFYDFRLNASLSAQERFKIETRAISSMAADGLPVPQLVAATPRYLISRDSGTPVNPNTSFEQLCKVMQVLAEFHRHGYSHGCPAIRDVLISESGEVTLIDFEESRGPFDYRMMARDVFLLMLDMYRVHHLSHQQRQKLIHIWQQEAPAQAVYHLLPLVKRFRRLEKLAKLALKLSDNREARFFCQTLSLFQ